MSSLNSDSDAGAWASFTKFPHDAQSEHSNLVLRLFDTETFHNFWKYPRVDGKKQGSRRKERPCREKSPGPGHTLSCLHGQFFNRRTDSLGQQNLLVWDPVKVGCIPEKDAEDTSKMWSAQLEGVRRCFAPQEHRGH